MIPMHKEIYLIKGLPDEDYPAFNSRIAGLIEYVTETVQPRGITYTITDQAPPPMSIIPFSRQKLAAISVYKDNTLSVNSFIDADGFYGAYQVTEALPVGHTKDWPDGHPTPGACLVTLFSKKKNIDHPTFIDRWHNSHTPLSLRYHPLWNYNRNVVDEYLTINDAAFHGIVEEQVREKRDLLNPFRFFGNPLIIVPRMIHVYLDTKSFIDYPTMETFLAKAYIVRSK
ncbi:MAG TPA: hypothetical protein PLV75_10370 [Saprospiraceae bacterium]|nr:hypothetical protein [Saprospiraceae bacterium]